MILFAEKIRLVINSLLFSEFLFAKKIRFFIFTLVYVAINRVLLLFSQEMQCSHK